MAASDVPLRTIQHWMGHADSKATQIYAHYQPSDAEADTVDMALSDTPPPSPTHQSGSVKRRSCAGVQA